MGEGSFEAAIDAHLQLQRRNRGLEPTMPIARYREGSAADSSDAGPPPPATPAAVDADAPTEAKTIRAAPWDDPDSWWNVREPAFDWGD